MPRIKEEVLKLKEMDVYSLMLFALYKIKDIPEYSSISELAYVLDKDNLLKLCEYFGGLTIRIPTIEDLETMLYSLLLYEMVNIKGMEYDKAIEVIGHKSSDLRKVKSDYNNICKILSNYNFGG